MLRKLSRGELFFITPSLFFYLLIVNLALIFFTAADAARAAEEPDTSPPHVLAKLDSKQMFPSAFSRRLLYLFWGKISYNRARVIRHPESVSARSAPLESRNACFNWRKIRSY